MAVPDAGTAVGITLNPETAWVDEASEENQDDPLIDNPYLPANLDSPQTKTSLQLIYLYQSDYPVGEMPWGLCPCKMNALCSSLN